MTNTTYKVRITEAAHQDLLSAAEKGHNDRLELAGSIVGTLVGQTFTVTALLPNGPATQRTYSHVRTDAAYQKRLLESHFASRPGDRYLGDWHIHPMPLPQLSTTDLSTAAKILQNEAKDMPGVLLLLGTVDDDDEPMALAFVATRKYERADAEEVDYDVISNDLDDAFKTDTKEGSNAKGGTGPSETARRRALADMREIERTSDAQTTLVAVDDELCAHVRCHGARATVLFPPEYPHGAPLVLAGHIDDEDADPVALRLGWSSKHSLPEVVYEALADNVSVRRQVRIFGRGVWRYWAGQGEGSKQYPRNKP